MFRSKTLFILGAGASQEVGLPIGDDLKLRIAQKIDIRFDDGWTQSSGDRQITEALRSLAREANELRSDINPYLQSCWALRDALPQAISIDNLLDAYREDKKSEICGKLGIVSSILEAERSSKIYCSDTDGKKIDFNGLNETWLHGLVKILTENVARGEIDRIFQNIYILNFNYDRCIEHYLKHALQIYYSLDNNAIENVMNLIKVIHPYGSVGKLPWQEGTHPPRVPFGSTRSDILSLSRQIKTFNESVHEEDEIKVIHELIEEAEIIVFLGFAFHRQNLQLITPNRPCKAKRVYATAFGISGSDCNVIESELREVLKQSGSGTSSASIHFRNDLKCGNLFNEYWRSLTASL